MGFEAEAEAEVEAEVEVKAEAEVEVEVEVEVKVEVEVEVENSPYKTYKNTEDKVASKMKHILCKQRGRAGRTQILQ
jgi:hypothetical protein